MPWLYPPYVASHGFYQNNHKGYSASHQNVLTLPKRNIGAPHFFKVPPFNRSKISNALSSSFMQVIILIIRFYQRYISPLTPPSCRFYPSCSAYTLQAVRRFGWYGAWLGAKRICKCHPWGGSGVDFVPLMRWNRLKFYPLFNNCGVKA